MNVILWKKSKLWGYLAKTRFSQKWLLKWYTYVLAMDAVK